MGHKFSLIIKEAHLDTFGHVNNATYLQLFEQARWDLVSRNGYGLDKIKSTGLGPVILKITISFLKEILLGQEIIIETRLVSYDKKIGVIAQRMLRDGVVCCEAEFKMGLFNLSERKLVAPTEAWLSALDIVA